MEGSGPQVPGLYGRENNVGYWGGLLGGYGLLMRESGENT